MESQVSQLVKEHCDRELELMNYKIEAKKASVSELAIDKTLKLLLPIGGVLALLIAASSYLGYNDIKSSAKKLVHDKVNTWFTFGVDESPFIEEINSLRDRYLIDSVTIRYLKAKAAPSSYPGFKLTDKEIENLIRIAKEKETKLIDFIDVISAIKLGTSGFSDLVDSIPGDYRGIQFEELFVEKGYKDHAKKQREILKVFSNDYSLVGLANKILEDDISHLNEYAFLLLSNTNQPFAIDYAKNKLIQKEYDDNLFVFAKYLARKDPLSKEFKGFFEHNLLQSENIKPYEAFDIFYELIDSNNNVFSIFDSEDKELKKYKKELAYRIFENLIKQGMSIRVDDRSLKMIARVDENSYVTISRVEAEKIFENDELLNWLVLKNKDNIEWLAKVINAFDLFVDRAQLVSIKAELRGNSVLTLDRKKDISKEDIEGDVLFGVGDNANQVKVSYKDKLGNITRDKVKSTRQLFKANFKFSFNKDELYRYSPYDF